MNVEGLRNFDGSFKVIFERKDAVIAIDDSSDDDDNNDNKTARTVEEKGKGKKKASGGSEAGSVSNRDTRDTGDLDLAWFYSLEWTILKGRKPVPTSKLWIPKRSLPTDSALARLHQPAINNFFAGVRDVIGDGNYGFRALGMELVGVGTTFESLSGRSREPNQDSVWSILRRELAEWLQDHKRHYLTGRRYLAYIPKTIGNNPQPLPFKTLHKQLSPTCDYTNP